jgi:RimJ/RimL family protein N-acetyltransferase
LDTIWYTLDGGLTNYTITSLTGTFNQTAWGALSEGSLIIRFYANDTGGNIGSAAVTVKKNTAPVITIIFPLPDSVFGLVAPNYSISIDELNLDTIWYTLDGGITNYTITSLTGTFNHLAWEALSEGGLTIRFYANDTAGNIGFTDVEVIIEISEDLDGLPIISFGNYYILFTFITITILSFIILEKQKKK